MSQLPRGPARPSRLIALAALTALAALAVALLACERPAPRGLVLITLDTVRRDHLGFGRYAKATSPTLDELAGRSVVFTNAFAQQTNTGPSHASMLTGLYPPFHGVQQNGDLLPADKPTLAEVLRRRGFKTAAFVSGVTLENELCGLRRGFEIYDDKVEGMRNRGTVATGKAVRWLAALSPGDRFFLFVHLYDAHGPYVSPRPYKHLFDEPTPGRELTNIPGYQKIARAGQPLTHLNDYVALYDSLIRYEDTMVARLLRQIDLDTTVVAVLADHGETLGERYRVLDHGAELFDEQLRIPLLLSIPQAPPRRVRQAVETVDLLPTFFEVLRVPKPAALRPQGRSLVPALAGGTEPLHTFVFASARAENAATLDRGYRLNEKRLVHSVRSRRWKLIVYPGLAKDYLELYDLAADPGETRNVAERERQVASGLRQVLDRWLAGHVEGRAGRPLSPDLRDKLRALGYAGA